MRDRHLRPPERECVQTAACAAPSGDRPAPAAAEFELYDRVVAQLYDLALDPRRIAHLPALWDQLRRTPNRPGTDRTDALCDHLHRVTALLRRALPAPPAPGDAAALIPCGRRAALTVDADLTLRRVNPAGAALLGLEAGQPLSSLPLEPASLALLQDQLRALLPAAGSEAPHPNPQTALLRLRLGETGALVIAQLARHGGQDGPPFVLVVTSLLHCPDELAPLLQQAYGLTSAECEVLRGLCKGQPLREIATSRGRSLETVRAQIKALMAKTESHSQAELLRLVLTLDPPPPSSLQTNPLRAGAIDAAAMAASTLRFCPEAAAPALPGWVEGARLTPPLAPPGPAAAPSRAAPRRSAGMVRFSHGGGLLPVRPFGRLSRGAGRWLEYLELGAPEGQAVLWLPGLQGVCRLPARHEAAAARDGLRLLVPVPAGYGGSTAAEPQVDAADVLALMDHLGLAQAPLVALGDALALGCTLAGRAGAGRISALIGVAPPPPHLTPAQLERMGPWQRLMQGTARDLPQVLAPLMELMATVAEQLGPMGFHRKLFQGSPADQATAGSLDFQCARASAQEILQQPDGTLAPRLIEDMIRSARRDLRPALAALQDRLPVHLLFGQKTLRGGPRLARDYARRFPWVQLQSFETAGELLHLQETRSILELAARLRP